MRKSCSVSVCDHTVAPLPPETDEETVFKYTIDQEPAGLATAVMRRRPGASPSSYFAEKTEHEIGGSHWTLNYTIRFLEEEGGENLPLILVGLHLEFGNRAETDFHLYAEIDPETILVPIELIPRDQQLAEIETAGPAINRQVEKISSRRFRVKVKGREPKWDGESSGFKQQKIRVGWYFELFPPHPDFMEIENAAMPMELRSKIRVKLNIRLTNLESTDMFRRHREVLDQQMRQGIINGYESIRPAIGNADSANVNLRYEEGGITRFNISFPQSQINANDMLDYALKYEFVRRCELCPKKAAFKGRKELLRHLNRLHGAGGGKTAFYCPFCDECLSPGRKDKWKEHLDSHGQTLCLCKKQCESVEALSNHIVVDHKGYIEMCKMCDRVFTNEKDLMTHEISERYMRYRTVGII